MDNPMIRSLHFQISTTENKPMKAWDLMLQVGGFKSKAEAEDFATSILLLARQVRRFWFMSAKSRLHGIGT